MANLLPDPAAPGWVLTTNFDAAVFHHRSGWNNGQMLNDVIMSIEHIGYLTSNLGVHSKSIFQKVDKMVMRALIDSLNANARVSSTLKRPC